VAAPRLSSKAPERFDRRSFQSVPAVAPGRDAFLFTHCRRLIVLPGSRLRRYLQAIWRPSLLACLSGFSPRFERS
jgi:hypothetical protein